MNEKKICFIVCTNDAFQMKECRLHIENLELPDGFNIEVQEIKDASSMTSGYNQGMHQSNAKYKIYLHQDVLIVYKNFLIEIINIFKNHPETGMLGMVGNTKITGKITPWAKGTVRIGAIYEDIIEQSENVIFGKVSRPMQNVIFIDGLLMATQYDVEWREDLFQGWDLYDLSQSMEFWRAGYEVAVPYMRETWVFHDNDISNMENYEKWKTVFEKEYRRDCRRWNGKSLEIQTSDKVIYQIYRKDNVQIPYPYPPVYEENADYICFTDCKALTSSYWKVIFVDNLESEKFKEIIRQTLAKYKQCKELEQNQIQIASLFENKKSYNPVVEIPDFKELKFIDFDRNNIVPTKDKDGHYIYEKNPVYAGGKYEGREYLLTIGMPVSNQIATIEKCLSHIQPLLNRLDAELVIADTGSTDGTIEVCRRYGARVIDFPWCNNMSAARNAVLHSARGLWYLSIDDDEWFENTDEIAEFFESGEYKKYNMASYIQRNYLDQTGEDYMDSHVMRIVRITEETHFEGRIHDAINWGSKVKPVSYQCSSYVHHYGFARNDKKKVEEKCKRNLQGLIYDVYEYPEDLRYNYQFANEYQVINDYENAAKLFLRGTSMGKELKNYQKLHYLNLLSCYSHINGDELYDMFELLESEAYYTDAEMAYLYYRLAKRSCQEEKEPEKILKYCNEVKKYIAAYQQDEERNWKDSELGLYICVDEKFLTNVEIMELSQYIRQNKTWEALEQINRIGSLDRDMNIKDYIKVIFDADLIIFEKAFGKIKPFQCCEYAALLLAELAKNSDGIYTESLLKKSKLVLEQISIPALQKNIADIEDRENLLKLLLCKNETNLIYEKWLKMHLLLEKYVKETENGKKEDNLELFLQYCESVYHFAKSYYFDEIIQGLKKLDMQGCVVSPDQRAAYLVAESVFSEKATMKQRVAYLKQAVMEFPGFKSEIAGILQQFR